MTQLLLEIPNRRDLALLLDLVERLDIRVLETNKLKASVALPKHHDEAKAKGIASIKTAQKNVRHAAVKPLRKKLRISDLKKEQQYKGINQVRLNRLIDDLDVQESVETLLAQLKA